MGHQIDNSAGEKAGCSSQITIADRIFYTKLFSNSPSRYFSADQQGVIEKEISRAEFELWIGILAENDFDVTEILKKLSQGKKY